MSHVCQILVCSVSETHLKYESNADLESPVLTGDERSAQPRVLSLKSAITAEAIPGNGMTLSAQMCKVHSFKQHAWKAQSITGQPCHPVEAHFLWLVLHNIVQSR